MNPHEMVGAYALHALDEDEARAFESHLGQCEQCQEELASFDVVLDELAEPGPGDPASVDPAVIDEALSPERRARLGRAVADAVETTAQVPASAGAGPASADATAGSPASAPPRRFRARTALLVAASTLVAVIAVGVGLFLGGGEQPSQLAQDLERIRGASDVVEAPLDLGESTVYVSAAEGIAVVGETPPLTDNQTYQLWIVPADGSAPVPGPVMAPGTSEATWDADLEGAAAIAVSVEPDGGSTTPTEVVTAFEL